MTKLLRQFINESLLLESQPRYVGSYKAVNGLWYLEVADNPSPESDDDDDDMYGNDVDGEREDATTYGPFQTYEKADGYIRDHWANPGGTYDDDSGAAPVPTKSPNGKPIVRPAGHFASPPKVAAPRVEIPKPTAPRTQPAATPASSPVKAAKKKTYKIYGSHHDAKLGSSPIHTRVGGKVYAPTKDHSKFNKGDAAEVTQEPENKLRLKKPDSDHSQVWSARESVEYLPEDLD